MAKVLIPCPLSRSASVDVCSVDYIVFTANPSVITNLMFPLLSFRYTFGSSGPNRQDASFPTYKVHSTCCALCTRGSALTVPIPTPEPISFQTHHVFRVAPHYNWRHSYKLLCIPWLFQNHINPACKVACPGPLPCCQWYSVTLTQIPISVGLLKFQSRMQCGVSLG